MDIGVIGRATSAAPPPGFSSGPITGWPSATRAGRRPCGGSSKSSDRTPEPRPSSSRQVRGGRDGGDPLQPLLGFACREPVGQDLCDHLELLFGARQGDRARGLASSELVARHLPGARVVKASNTICYERLQDNGCPEAPLGEREAIFVAGDDDEEAERVVSRLIEEVGRAPVDAGALAESGRQEPGSPVYNVAMVPDRARETLAGIG